MMDADDDDSGKREVAEKKKVDCDGWYQVDFDFEELELVADYLEEEKRAEYARTSFARTKNSIYYLARSNVWDWFVTLTLNPAKIDRYDYAVCSKRVRQWFNNLRKRKAPGLYYLIVPERHKDGAWHFHGLLGGCAGLTFVDSGVKDDKGNQVFNFEDFKLGWTTATRVNDSARASSYICKYISKELCMETAGRQRYWVSNNVQRADEYEVVIPWVHLKEFREKLFDNMTWKKKTYGEFFDVEYFEVLPEWEKVIDEFCDCQRSTGD